MEDFNLNIFESITLKEMDEVSLMKRQDTKFVLSTDILPIIISKIKNFYRILEINENRLMSYTTIYFDTKDTYFYKMHHNGIAKRVKVRIRKYEESDLCFLEVKQKDKKGNTDKKRIKVSGLRDWLTANDRHFVNQTIENSFHLQPSIEISFNRFTLVSTSRQERITIDTNLRFDGDYTIQNLAIIELKQEKLDRTSPIYKALKEQQVRPLSVSKYCLGMAHKKPSLKFNRFKLNFLKIKKLNA